MSKERMTRYEATTGIANVKRAIKNKSSWVGVLEHTTVAFKNKFHELMKDAGYITTGNYEMFNSKTGEKHLVYYINN